MGRGGTRWDRTGLDEPGLAKTADGKRRLTAPDWEPEDEEAEPGREAPVKS